MRKVLGLATIVGLAAIGIAETSNVEAGSVDNNPFMTEVRVSKNAAGGAASGTLRDARVSADTRQHIGCWASVHATGFQVQSTVNCSAMDAFGNAATCSFAPRSADSPETVMATSIGPYSFVAFQWDTSGRCTNLEVHQSSTRIKPLPH